MIVIDLVGLVYLAPSDFYLVSLAITCVGGNVFPVGAIIYRRDERPSRVRLSPDILIENDDYYTCFFFFGILFVVVSLSCRLTFPLLYVDSFFVLVFLFFIDATTLFVDVVCNDDDAISRPCRHRSSISRRSFLMSS